MLEPFSSNKFTLDRVDIYANNYCNFHCANCLTFVRQQPKRIEYKVDMYTDPLKQLQTYANIKLLHILGGEPTLHSDLEDFVVQCRDCISEDTQLEVISNGWWMPNEDKFANVWSKIDKLGQGVHPELLNRMPIEEIRACMKRVRDKFNIITNLYLDPSFAALTFTDITNKGITKNCRFNTCTCLCPDGRMLRDGNIAFIPNIMASVAFNKAKKLGYYDVATGNAESLKKWRTTTPVCCEFCMGDTINVPHFGYEVKVIQEYKYPGDEQ